MKLLKKVIMKLHNYKYILLILLLTNNSRIFSQDTTARELLLNASYFMPADNIPYVKITAKEKVERKFVPQKDISGGMYFGEVDDANLISKIKTNDKGEAVVYMPPSFKDKWDSAPTLKFIAVSEANKTYASTTSEIEITKARIEIDTSTVDDVKNINVKVSELKNGVWLPASEVELKVAVKRSLSNLPVGDDDTYTTDSTGTITAEFKRDTLLGDEKGNLMLVARTEDNDTFGNIYSEITVPWGVPPVIDHSFFSHRSLWSTRFKTPYWLLALAYSIISAVWGTLIYLFIQIFKVRKIGKMTTD